MIRKGTADIPNCHVCASDLYLVSRATFPAYFIKDKVRAEAVKADIDIEFFAGRLAPALGITRRFVGEEPLDPVTRSYNQRMKELLPQRGIELTEIPRYTDSQGEPVSASRVRALIREIQSDKTGSSGSVTDQLEEIRSMVPETTYETILKHL